MIVDEVKAGANQRQLPGAANSTKTQSVTPGWPDRPQLEERTLCEGSSLTSVDIMGRGRSPGEGWGEGGLGALHLAPALRGLGPRYSLPRPLLSGASTPEKGKRRSLEELLPGTSDNESPRNGVSRSSPDLTPLTRSTSQRGMRKLSAEELLLDTPDMGHLIIPRLSPYAGRPWTEDQLLRSVDTQEKQLQIECPWKEEHILEMFRTEEEEGHTEQLQMERSQREEQLLKILKPEVNIQRQLQENLLHEKVQPGVSVLSEELQNRLNGGITGKEDVPAALSMHSPPTCSCCLASKSLDDLDPWAPWAFTQSNNGQRKKTRNRKGFYRVLLLSTSSLLLLGIGLLYLSQATQAMLHGMPDY